MTQDNLLLAKRKEMQGKMIFKLIGKMRKGGFQQLKMEEIAGLMDVSRATLYKYFSNKEEVMTRITDGLTEYVESMLQTDQDFYNGFQQIFEQNVSIALLITDDFLRELQKISPDLYFQLVTALSKRNEVLKRFYEKGMKQSIFNQLNPAMILLQNQLFQTLFDPEYLVTQQLTIENALRNFYQLQKMQLFQPSYLTNIDEAQMEPKFDYLTKKIATIIYTHQSN
ncbi:MAG: TetR/AcrR family transcriptional regulator [Enterococcus sp.]